jgi:hypothetical protein
MEIEDKDINYLLARKKGVKKRIKILLDPEDYSRFKNSRVVVAKDKRVYAGCRGKKVMLARAILNLTDPKDRVFFKNSNKYDMRKSNLVLKSVPEKNRGRYAVQPYNPDAAPVIWKKMFPEDPCVRFKKCFTSAILSKIVTKESIRKDQDSRAAQAFAALCYTIEDLKNHLESLFEEGMTWENYGKPDGIFEAGWHVDHIKPQCAFYFRSVEDLEFKECWSLSNLRPLWALDNLKKAVEDKKLSINKERKLWANTWKKAAPHNFKSGNNNVLSLEINRLESFQRKYNPL